MSILYTANDFREDMILYYLILLQGYTVCLDKPFLCYWFVRREGESDWNSIASKRDVAKETLKIAYRILKWKKKEGELSRLGYYWLNGFYIEIVHRRRLYNGWRKYE